MRQMTLSGPIAGIVVGGGIAATFDIVYAIVRNVQHGKTPMWVLQSVASGWMGADAFDSGIPGALLGLFSHYSILLIAAALYFLASQRLAILRSQTLISGVLFGVLIYLFMNFVVLPLSAFPYSFPYPAARLIEGFVSHACFVGLPIALAIHRFTRPQQ